MKCFESVTAKIIGRGENLICDGLLKAQLKEDAGISGFNGLGLIEIVAEQSGCVVQAHTSGISRASKDGGRSSWKG